MIGPLFMGEQGLDRGNEVVRDGAAEAAVREFDDVFVGAVVDAAGSQNLPVDAHVAEFIDHERETPVTRAFSST